MTQVDTSLARILAGEPLPRLPVEENPEVDKWRKDLLEYLRKLAGRFTSLNLTSDPGLRIDDENGFIETPQNKDYTLVEYAGFKFQLDYFAHETVSGSLTVAFKKNGVALTGTGDNTVSATQGIFIFDENLFEVGDKLEMTVSGVSSPVDFAFTLIRTAIFG